ncbi:hypothetical protein PSHT_11164 [Puccinia striiformis]|uniref:Uncharacterized protein n=1 Tax=Puccinia striiformis TaxID=27350 RepID=A0A2S4V4Y2_9BASI|nr:hypothetical protein PSHT_11164 [Puccinia striiformis]
MMRTDVNPVIDKAITLTQITKSLYSLPLRYGQNYNFAITHAFYASIGTDPLKIVAVRTPQFGFQAPIKKEFVSFPNVFGTSDKGIEQLKFTAHKSKKPKVHKQQ